MTSKLVVNEIAADTGISTITVGDNMSGVTFKTGTSNLHNVGIEIAGINVLGADTPIGAGATIYNSGDVLVGGAVTATAFSGSGASLTALNGSNIASGTVATARLGSGTANSSTFLRGDGSWASNTSTTINNNANNRLITGSGTANTLEGESTLTYDGTMLFCTGGTITAERGAIPSVESKNSTSSSYARFYCSQTSGSGGYAAFQKLGTTSTAIGGANATQIWCTGDAPLVIGVNNGEKLRIGAGGTVSISQSDHAGAQTLGADLVVADTTGASIIVGDTGSGEYLRLEGGAGICRVGSKSNHDLVFHTNGISNERLRIDTSGDLTLTNSSTSTTAALSAIKFANGVGEVARIRGENRNGNTNGMITFHSDISGTLAERMRINHDGAFCFGSDSARPAEFTRPNGFSIRWDDKGQFQSTVTNTTGGLMNREGSDGGILSFRRGGTGVGEIGVNASSIYLNFGGTNAAAHQLDDYEEGTWTPGASGFTMGSVTSATYTKIGRLVFVQCYINTASGSGGSTLIITGLPFTVKSGNIYQYATGRIGSASYNNSQHMITFEFTTGNTTVIPKVSDGNINWGMASNTHIMFSGCYQV